MAGDGAIPVSPKSKHFADRTARNTCSEHKAASRAASMRLAGTPAAYADKVSTPFFDLLTTMIEAHAAESGRTQQNTGLTGRIDVIPSIADARDSRRAEVNAAGRWHAQQLKICVVGLIVAVGSLFYVSEAGKVNPPAILADQAFKARSVAIGNADANDESIEKPLEGGEPDRSRTVDVEETRTGEGGIGSKSTFGADSNGQADVMPVVGQSTDKLGSDTDNRADGAAEDRPPSEAVRTDPIAAAAKASAEEPSRRDVLSSQSPADETGAKAPVAIQVARTISGANMRAGPNNGQQVLATIPRGSSIEVIKCRDWCEVVFAGQRGWVYKAFIRAPLADGAMLPERTKPSPRKPGSNSGVSRRTGTTWASVPHQSKPATARPSAGQSSQSSSGPIFWGAIEYLWKQIGTAALWPNSH
jgi:hypothetical protein